MIDVKKLNKTLVGFPELRRFDLAFDAAHQGYRLTLTLADKADATLTLHFHDVQNLELNPAGSGFERFIQLQVEDMREDGLDRVHYSVEELERETLFLHCAEIEILEAQR
jgi:hypothetical protein